MQTYIALLRGVNVSAQKMIKMSELLVVMQNLGFKKVKTYIQSGNIIFQAEDQPLSEIEQQIAAKITQVFNFSVPVLVKTAADWLWILQNNPFINERYEDTTKLHVTLLSNQPDPVRIAKINPDAYVPDELRIVENVIYVHCPNGYGRTKLHNNFFENKLKLNATTRNWKTMQELMHLADTITT